MPCCDERAPEPHEPDTARPQPLPTTLLMSGVGNVRSKSDKLGVVRSVSPMQQWNYPHQYRLQTACEICGLTDVGLPPQGQLDEAARHRLLAVLVKADPATAGHIRRARHIMLDDSDINATRHARALVGGVLAGVMGCTDLFVSGGAEHQGPDGGGPIAVIARR